MKRDFPEYQLDDFIAHWLGKYPDALANIFRYWDELHFSNNARLLARILHQERQAVRDFPARSDITSDSGELLHEFHQAVINRIRHLRQTGRIVAARNYPPGNFD